MNRASTALIFTHTHTPPPRFDPPRHPPQILVGHKDYVRAVIALPPAKPNRWGWHGSEAVQGRVVSASGDSTLRVWYVKTGRCLKVLQGHGAAVQCVAALPTHHDGTERIVSGSFDMTLRIWDPQSGRCLQVLPDHTHRIRSVAALPDGRFVSGADDITVRVWRVAGTPVPVQPHKELKDRVLAKEHVTVSPARTSRSPSPSPAPANAGAGATLRSTGMLVNGLAMTRRGIKAQIRQLQSLLGGAGHNAEMAAAAGLVAAEPAVVAVARKAEGAGHPRAGPSAGGDLGLTSPAAESRDGEEYEGERRHQHQHQRRTSRDGHAQHQHQHHQGSREGGTAFHAPSSEPSLPRSHHRREEPQEASPASNAEASPVSSEMQSPMTDGTGSTAYTTTPMSAGSGASGEREHRPHRSHHHGGHHHQHHRRRSHEEAARKKEQVGGALPRLIMPCRFGRYVKSSRQQQ